MSSRASGLEELERIAEADGVGAAMRTSLRPQKPEEETSSWLLQVVEAEQARVAPFELVAEIGKGGMGRVFKAVQADLGREVALKEITAESRSAVAHFIAEARITGLLEHANVVPVHMLTRSPEGVPQIAMKLVEGRSLRDLIYEQPERQEELLRHLLAACNAVAYAHQRAIVHRDLKPENIMVGGFGEVFVLDWGIAAGLDEPMCRRHGILFVNDWRGPAGTPAYMAPELARGRSSEQGRHTDVYLLGSCLHELIAREPRHGGETISEVMSEALISEPRRYGDDVPAELGEIANRATAANPDERYASVAAFMAAIEAYLEHTSAHAIAAEGHKMLAELRAAIARHLVAGGEERRELVRAIARCHAGCQFAFRHALDVWSGTREAQRGARECAEVMIEHAIATEDVGLAERTLADLEGDPAEKWAREVAQLTTRLSARSRELDELRAQARRLRWKDIGGPLGRVFMLSGIIGSCVVLSTQQVIARQMPHAFWINATVWTVAGSSIGLYATRTLRGAHVPGSLVSPRVLATWGAVGIGCLGVGLFNDFRPVKLAMDMCYPALLMAVGFVSMAMQTRRWLLAAALMFYAGAIAIALRPDYGYEVFAVVWLTAMSGVGVALGRGATLDDEEANSS